MTFDSPILGLCLLPVVAIAVVAAGKWLPAAGRWLFRSAAVVGLIAVAGVNLRCERTLKIAVMVDVSPSTRGAAFRDENAVEARLTPLLAGRKYALRYFADGAVTSNVEPAAERTVLPSAGDADAIVLMSDGRFDVPTGLPPVFAVVDPALDSPGDARVRDVRRTETGVTADVVSAGRERPLLADGESRSVPVGPAVVALKADRNLADRWVGFPPGDRWPENDSLRFAPATEAIDKIALELSLPGFRTVSWADVPNPASACFAGSVIVAPARPPGGRDELGPLISYVENGGGTLVLADGPAAGTASWRAIDPLSGSPPASQRWVILLDSSGSMATKVDGESRWQHAVRSAEAAIDRLPDNARVTVMVFAGTVESVIADAKPREAGPKLFRQIEDQQPRGESGLREAMLSMSAVPSADATRVLLLTDGDVELGDAVALGRMLASKQIMVNGVVSAPSAQVAAMCRASGGQCKDQVAVADWSTALGRFADEGRQTIEATEKWAGNKALTGFTTTSSRRTQAWVKAGADVLLGDESKPAAALWRVGLGHVASVAAELSQADVAAVATRLAMPVRDARYAASIDEPPGIVRLTAMDAGRPMSGIAPVMPHQFGSTQFDQVRPGVYEAKIDRLGTGFWSAISVDGRVIARLPVVVRYPVEFDAIGNDREALAKLAGSTGGAVIEAGDNRPISFPRVTAEAPLRGAATVTAIVLLLGAVGLVRKTRIR